MSNETKRQICFDSETTGLEPSDGHRLLELGAVEIIDRKITGKNFHIYIDPERDVPEEAEKVHGISREKAIHNAELNVQKGTQKGILFADIVEDFIEFCRDAEVIIHNAPFDLSFVDNELSTLPKSSPYHGKKFTDFCTVTDSLVIARNKYPGKFNSLDKVALRLGVDNSARKDSGLHGALMDSDLLAHVYLAMTTYQNQLIKDPNKKTIQYTLDVKRLSLPGIDALPTVGPSQDETAEHDKMMKTVEKKSGEPLWSSFDM